MPCHFYLEYDCPELDVPRYEAAWNRLIARHPMLRATVTPAGRIAVHDDLPAYRIRVHDLTGLPEDRRTARLASLRERMTRQPGRPDRWPLAQIQAATLPGGRTRLFIGVDALICDAASWWILERELRTLYTDPDTPLPPIGIDPAACVAALAHRRDGAAGERAAAYWRERLDTLPGAPELPVREPYAAPRFTRRSARLDAAEWAALQAEAARRRITPTAVLLAAYAETLAAWSGTQRFCVVLTLFDRPDVHPHVHRVVGDFTSLVLHETAPSTGTFAQRAEATQRQLFADLDHREFSALDVLAEASVQAGEVRSVPVVFTSALGMDDVVAADGELEWVGEQVTALSQTPQTLLDHQVLTVGGQLRLQFDALEGVLAAEDLDRVVTEHAARVRRLATGPAAWDEHPIRAGDPGGRAAGAAPMADIALPLRAAGGTGHTLFLLHPSGGDVVCYAELSRLLDERVDVVALTDPELIDTTAAAPGDIPTMARRYLEAIRDLHRGGPYLLGGWSMGGTVAQEMARQLHGEHRAVPLLVLLDSNDPVRIRPVDGASADGVEAELLWRYLGALEAFLGVDLGAGHDSARRELAALPSTRRREQASRRLAEHHLLARGEMIDRRLAVFARHLDALARHAASPLPGNGTATLLVRADRRAPRNSEVGMGVDDTPQGLTDLGWGQHLTGPLRVVGVDAHHYALLHGPALPRVAEEINHMLRQALP